MENIGDIEHYKECFTPEEREVFFSRLYEEVPWTTQLWRRGKYLPRKIYRYDLPRGAEDTKIEILENLIEEVEQMMECNVMGVWCNLYENGKDYTPPHQDLYGAHVITLSFGESRRCIMENIETKEKTEHLLEDGDLFYFSPNHDSKHKHSIPKGSVKLEPRISIVFFTTAPFSSFEPRVAGEDDELEEEFPYENIPPIMFAIAAALSYGKMIQ